METVSVDKDIVVFYISARSFPDGVQEAHQKLHSLIPFSQERKYFGISRPENGTIVYRAGAEELNEGEAGQLGCDTVTLKKGEYLCITVEDFMNDLPAIGESFERLIRQPGIDPQGYCVEWYVNNNNVKCMIRLL